SRSRREFPTVTVGGVVSIHVFDQFNQMAVLNLLDAVGKNYKSAIDLVQLAALKLVSQLFTAQRQRVPAGVLAQHQSRIGHAHRLRRHDFVGQRILEHAILVNSGLMRKRIAASDGLVWLHRDTCDFRQRLAGSVQLFGGNCGFVRITVRRTRMAMTISSREALPARSPMPLMVHSTWRAPCCTPASEFATA